MTRLQMWFLAILMLFSPGLSQAQSSDYDPIATEKAQDFVTNFFDQWSTPNSVALPFIRSVMDSQINFYGKVMSRDAFMTAQEDFANRWPERLYSIEPNSEDVDCNDTTSICTVTGIDDWNDFSPARHVISTGSAKFSISLHVLQTGVGKDPTFLISAESGSVISTEIENAIDDSDVLLGPSANSNFTPLPMKSSGHLVVDAAIQHAGCISPDGPIQHKNCTSVFEMDLTKTFHTKDKTVFEVTQASYDQNTDFPPALSFCFFRSNLIQCEYGTYPDPAGGPDDLVNSSVVYPTENAFYPLLEVELLTEGGAGCGGFNNDIWAYNPANNSFKLIWTRLYNCFTTLRFETKGPLAGDMITVDDDVTGRWPWPYGMEVYKFVAPDRLIKLLYFAGKAGQGGKYVTGPNDAIDVDMPEILRRLGK